MEVRQSLCVSVFLKAEDHFWFEIQQYAWLDFFVCAGKMTFVVLGLTRMKYLLKVKSVSTYFSSDISWLWGFGFFLWFSTKPEFDQNFKAQER